MGVGVAKTVIHRTMFKIDKRNNPINTRYPYVSHEIFIHFVVKYFLVDISFFGLLYRTVYNPPVMFCIYIALLNAFPIECSGIDKSSITKNFNRQLIHLFFTYIGTIQIQYFL